MKYRISAMPFHSSTHAIILFSWGALLRTVTMPLCAVMVAASPAAADVVGDINNSLGTVVNGELGGSCSSGLCSVDGGTSNGSNLFHRFSTFDTRGGITRVSINASGSGNVIVGVTNPLGSFIDKPISLSNPANLFWLSPGGISISGAGGFQNVQNLNLSTATGLDFSNFTESGLTTSTFDVANTKQDQITDSSSAFAGFSPGGLNTDLVTLANSFGLDVNGDLIVSNGTLTVSSDLLLDAQGGNVLLQSSVFTARDVNLRGNGIIVQPGSVVNHVGTEPFSVLRFDAASVSINAEILANVIRIDTGSVELGPLASLTATRSGGEGFLTSIDILIADAFVNRSGPDALNVQPGSRWLIESFEPRNYELGGLPFDFKEYGVCFNECSSFFPGNGLIYEVVPELNPVLGEVRKIYDGTANALIPSLGVLGAPGDLIDGDFVGSADLTNASYLTAGTGLGIPDVGTGKRVQLFASNLQILAPVSPGRTAPVYGYVIPSATTPFVGDRGAITPKPLSVLGTSVDSKIYDGTTAAVLRGGRLQGVVGSQDVGLIEAGSFITKNASSSPIPVVSSSRLTGTANLSNYFLRQPSGLSGFINPRQLTGTITALDKDFDGTADATIASRNLNGVLTGDLVNYVGGVARFDDPAVGTSKRVTATGLGLIGTDAGNYLVNDTAETQASIRPVTQPPITQPPAPRPDNPTTGLPPSGGRNPGGGGNTTDGPPASVGGVLDRSVANVAPVSPQDPLPPPSTRPDTTAMLPSGSSEAGNALTPSLVITDTRSSVTPPFEGPDLVDGPDLAFNLSDLSFITLSLQQATTSFVEGEAAAQQETANKLGLDDETVDPDGTRVETVQAMLRKMMCATRRDQTSPACRERS